MIAGVGHGPGGATPDDEEFYCRTCQSDDCICGVNAWRHLDDPEWRARENEALADAVADGLLDPCECCGEPVPPDGHHEQVPDGGGSWADIAVCGTCVEAAEAEFLAGYREDLGCVGYEALLNGVW